MPYILIVEDTMDHAALFSVILQQSGYKTKLCTNGEDAWNMLQTTNDLPSLILTDVSMPIMDGYELCFLIKNDASFSSIPVILVTAIYPGLTAKVAVDMQADAVIEKPIDFKQLLDTVKRFLP